MIRFLIFSVALVSIVFDEKVVLAFQEQSSPQELEKLVEQSLSADNQFRFINCVVSEPRAGKTVSRKSVVWGFSDDRQVSLSVPMKYELPAESDLLSLDSLEMFSDRSIRIRNAKYTAVVGSEGGENYIRILKDGFDALALNKERSFVDSMKRVQPFNLQFREFKELEGVSLQTAEELDGELVKLEYTALLSESETGYGSPYEGVVEIFFHRENRCIAEQMATSAEAVEVHKYRFLQDVDKPVEYDHILTKSNGTPLRSKNVKFSSLEQIHSMPSEACYLSYFGLPEPEGAGPPASITGWLVLAACLAIGVILFFFVKSRKYN